MGPVRGKRRTMGRYMHNPNWQGSPGLALQAAQLDTGSSSATGHRERERIEKQSPRILIVEDDYFIALDSEATLRAAGFDILGIAATGEQAVALALNERPTLVLMDIRLRGDLDGVDAAIEIYRRTGIACVFASAYANAGMQERAAPAKPLGWLSKPFTPRELLVAVNEALEETERRRAHH